MKLEFNFWIKTALIFLISSTLYLRISVGQGDGLDQNSFDTPASDDDKAPDQDFTIQDNTDDMNINGSNAENTDFDPNAPVFDQGALPDENSPENLSDQIRDMNPDSISGQLDYFPSFIYDERGRKDPFTPVIRGGSKSAQQSLDDIPEPTAEERIRAGLAKFEVASLTLTAVLIGNQNRPKALIKDPAGTVYVIHENDIVGRNNGVVKKIRQGQVVILEYRDQPEGDRLYTTQVLSLGK